MNASKETARQAKQYLSKMPPGIPRKFIEDFLDAAERKLPTEAAYQKERQRRKQPHRPRPPVTA